MCAFQLSLVVQPILLVLARTTGLGPKYRRIQHVVRWVLVDANDVLQPSVLVLLQQVRCQQQKQLLRPRRQSTAREAQLPVRQPQVGDAHSQIFGERIGQELPLEGAHLEQKDLRVRRFWRLVHQTDLGQIRNGAQLEDLAARVQIQMVQIAGRRVDIVRLANDGRYRDGSVRA